MAGTGLFYVLATFFGASLAQYKIRTLLLSLLLSILVLWTPAFALGLPFRIRPSLALSEPQYARWVRIFASHKPLATSSAETHLLYSSGGAILGAWVGAFPIALDWDRPWQVSCTHSESSKLK
jgi:phosphatidylinositol glycan class F